MERIYSQLTNSGLKASIAKCSVLGEPRFSLHVPNGDTSSKSYKTLAGAKIALAYWIKKAEQQ